MQRLTVRAALLLFLLIVTLFLSIKANAITQGIYITQSTLENTEQINYLIERSKKAGITTFIVDMERPSKKYQNNITLLKSNNIIYIARIVMFPDGGTAEQIASENYWEKKYGLVKVAISYGAEQIQLDYIRYKASQKASPENAKNVLKVIAWFKSRPQKQGIPLQVDVFGISSFGESKHIGQNIKLFSESINTLCPMVYPSHYEPFREHAVTPYETIYSSLEAIKKQFVDGKLPFQLIPYIEFSNYRYPLSKEKKLNYIREQIRAVENAKADGWYAWSPHNKYDNLFTVLEKMEKKI